MHEENVMHRGWQVRKDVTNQGMSVTSSGWGYPSENLSKEGETPVLQQKGLNSADNNNELGYVSLPPLDGLWIKPRMATTWDWHSGCLESPANLYWGSWPARSWKQQDNPLCCCKLCHVLRCVSSTYTCWSPSLYCYIMVGDMAYMDLISINLQGGGGTGLQHWCLLKDTLERFLTSPVAHVPGNKNYKKTALTHQEISRILVLEFWLLEMWEIFCLPQHLVSGILSRQPEKTDVCSYSQRPTSFTALHPLREHRVRWGGARCHPATCASEVSLGYIASLRPAWAT